MLNTPFYAVPQNWLDQLVAFLQDVPDAAYPGPLDSSSLASVDPETQIVTVKPNLDPLSYRFVSPQCWMRIVAWYKGPNTFEIKRKVCRLATSYVVEMYPIEVQVDFLGYQFLLRVSRHSRMRTVRHWAATTVSITPHRCELLIVDLLPPGGGMK